MGITINNMIDKIIRAENRGCNPYTDDIIKLNARCNENCVEVFITGKWRPLLRCQNFTTEIRNKNRLAAMKSIIRTNTGWGKDEKLLAKEIQFTWVKN